MVPQDLLIVQYQVQLRLFYLKHLEPLFQMKNLIINESEESFRSIVSVRQYTFEDVKSVYQNTNGMTGGITGFMDFSADTVLETTRISSIPQVNNCNIN